MWTAILGIVIGCSFQPAEVMGPDRGDQPSVDGSAPPADRKQDASTQPPGVGDAAVAGPEDASAISSGCPSGYTFVYGTDSWVRFESGSATWLEAELACEQDGSGTHLIVVDGAIEERMLVELGEPRWIGLSSRQDPGVWRWVTGEVEDSSGASVSTGLCAAAAYGDVRATTSCDTSYRWVCECDGVPASSDYY